ncbi:MAG: hypothetical protein JWQ71_1957 [Pedosphaera sp.]|nr:hypothetical protein [Pedosphaera sp.]
MNNCLTKCVSFVRTRKFISTAVVALALSAGSLAVQAEEGFTSLFNGKDLTGWKYFGNKGGEYLAKDGLIVCTKNSHGNLLTEAEYSDFVLRLEFKLEPDGNNGVAIRVPFGGAELTYTGVEIQILDDKAPMHANIKPWQFNGSVYGIVPAQNGTPMIGKWNKEEITCVGRHYKVVLNGKVIVDADLNDVHDAAVIRQHPGFLRDRGHIGFLGHANHVEFRNIRIKELTGKTVASNNTVFKAKWEEGAGVQMQEVPAAGGDNVAPKGFVRLFNGKDLTGWKGLVANPPKRAKMSPEELSKEQVKADKHMQEHWKAMNGEIVFDGKGDSLCTLKDYGDFELLVDWKIPAKGDSGIYLRGSPQVQIWEAHSPGQFNPVDGSGGLYNNEKNPRHALKVADKPVGEWNHFRIVMVGEKVHVFLNGELVVRDTTLENYWERDKPIYPMGQIELQNHGGPLWFKNVYIREIPSK